MQRVMEWLQIIILGIIEGITEFLPVSSTGHLLISQQWLPPQTDLFNIVIQSGAVCAVILVFAEHLKTMAKNWRSAETQDYVMKLGGSFLITAIGGLLLKAFDFELPDEAAPVAWALMIGGLIIFVVEYYVKGKNLPEVITWKVAIVIGLAQLVAAIFPGASRSGTTIIAAMALGTHRKTATEFSFILGIPTLLAAAGLEIVSAVMDPPEEPIRWDFLALGAIVSLITAFAAVKWLLKYVQSHTFNGFGWYRIGLGVLVILLT